MTKLMGRRGMARVKAVEALLFGFVLAAGMSSSSAVAEAGSVASSAAATHTMVKAETREVNGRTIATVDLSVESESDSAARGTVALVENGRGVAGAALNAQGKVTITLDGLTPGDHSFEAVYSGDTGHVGSKSESLAVHSNATVTPDFTLTISAASLAIAAPGDSGSLTATVTPVAGTGFTGFLSLSCSGPAIATGSSGGSALPFGVSCTYSPANLEVVAGTTGNPTGAQSANLSIQTTAPSGQESTSGTTGKLDSRGFGKPLVLAVLLPGVFGLGLLARKRGVLLRGTLMLALGVMTLLGMSACNPRYRYLNHPPTYNPGTAAGDYTITVTAQTSNGVSATEHSDSLALTVK